MCRTFSARQAAAQAIRSRSSLVRIDNGCLARWKGNGSGGFTRISDHSHDYTQFCGRPSSNVMIGLGDLNADGNGDVAGTDLITTSMVTWFSDGACNFNPTGQHFCCFGAFILT